MFDLTDEKSFEDAVKANPDLISVLQFGTDWCQNCAKVSPILKHIEKECRCCLDKAECQPDCPEQKIQFGLIDVDAEVELAEKYRVYSVPTICIFVGDQIVERIVGVHEKEVYEQAIMKYFQAETDDLPSEKENIQIDQATAEPVQDNLAGAVEL